MGSQFRDTHPIKAPYQDAFQNGLSSRRGKITERDEAVDPRSQRSKAELIEEIDRLRRRVALLEAAAGEPDTPAGDSYLAKQDLVDLAKFPSENPNPVLRVTREGKLLYANDAARAFEGLLTGDQKDQLTGDLPRIVAETHGTGRPRESEIWIKDRILAVSVAPVAGENYANLYGRDVTQRKRAEKALRESRELLTAIVNVIPAMINAKDRQSRYVFINRYQAELYGVSANQAVGQTAEELLGAEYGAHTRSLDRQVLASGEPLINFEEDHVDAFGVHRQLLATKVPLKDEAGIAYGVATVALDITDLKNAELALRDSTARFQQATRLASLGHWAWDEIKDRCTYCSEELARIHGMSVDQYLTTMDNVESDIARVHPDDREAYNRITRNGWSDDDTYDIEYRILRPDGEIRHVRELAEAIRDSNGRVVRSIGTKQDITEPKRIQDDLRETSAFLQLDQIITQAANEATSLERAVQTALDQICDQTDWPVGHAYFLDEARGDLVSARLWHGEGASRFEAFRHASQGTRFAHGIGLPGRVLATGRPAWIADLTLDENFPRAQLAADIGLRAGAAFPVLVGRKVVAVLEFYAQAVMVPHPPLIELMAQIGTQLGRVAERAASEQALIAAKDEAMAATQAKSRFLANMSHELRTPMNAIIGFTRLVLRRSEQELDPKQFANLEKVLASGERLLLLIDDILDLSKIEAGQMTLERSAFSLKALVDDCLRTVEPMTKGGKVELRRDIESDGADFHSDEAKVRQVLLNLLSNAVKFTPDGSVTVRIRREGDALVMAVADSGIGIPEDALALIFEEFGQSAVGRARHYGGTGLGLSITRQLVHFLGGAITVQSVAGEGSTFQVTLPSLQDDSVAP